MYFTKNEIIELNDNSKYIISDTAYIDDIAYYKIKKMDNDKITDEIKYITVENKDGKLYINEDFKQKDYDKMVELFQE